MLSAAPVCQRRDIGILRTASTLAGRKNEGEKEGENRGRERGRERRERTEGENGGRERGRERERTEGENGGRRMERMKRIAKVEKERIERGGIKEREKRE